MSPLQTFQFTTKAVRVHLDASGAPWFIAADVCKALTLGNTAQAITKLDDDEKGVISNDTLGGQQEMVIINESGLYSLILGCRKPAAKRFKKWVTAEVLPSLRRTGIYTLPGATRTGTISSAQYQDLMQTIRVVCGGWVLRGEFSQAWVINHLRARFDIRSVQTLPAQHFDEAMDLVAAKRDPAWQFLTTVTRMREQFEREVLGGGQAWTPTKRRGSGPESGALPVAG